LPEPYRRLLELLADCSEAPPSDTVLYRQQNQGATYRSVAAIAYRVGMSKQERLVWYKIAERVPLAQRHVGHIIRRVGEDGLTGRGGRDKL
jgi:hypothetical protein